MKLFINVASAAIVCTCLFPVAASADARGEPVSVRVSHAGLDLNSDAGRAVFQRRLQSAIARTCEPRAGGLDAVTDARLCREEMTADAKMKMATIDGHHDTQLASTGAAR